MKYNGVAKVYGVVFTRLLKKYYRQHYPLVDIDAISKDVRHEYRAIIQRTPDIGKNMVSPNLIGAAYFFAVAKVVPDMTPELMDKIIDDILTSDFMFKLTKSARKKGKIFSKKVQDKWLRDAERSQNSTNEFDWQYTYTEGENNFEYRYTRCGVCKLAEVEGVLDYLPCMCRMDYQKFALKGARLTREHTIAGGDGYCDFHVERVESRE